MTAAEQQRFSELVNTYEARRVQFRALRKQRRIERDAARVDRTAAETLFLFLVSRFPSRHHPRLVFGARSGGRGFHSPGRNIIHLCRKSEYWIVAHEFAHWLDHEINGNGAGGECHSQSFYHNLLRVIDAIGWARSEYPWAKEYRQLSRWARRDGHTVDS